jgi:hypothetical protein
MAQHRQHANARLKRDASHLHALQKTMGFQVEINSILRTDEPYQLAIGATYDFHKKGSRVFIDTIPIWLASNDWTALAEIKILEQSRTPAEVTGKFTVSYLYPP